MPTAVLHHDECWPLQWRHNGGDGIPKHMCLDYLFNCLFRHRSKKTSKLCVTGLCEVTGFPSHRARNTENVSICWRHHAPCWPDCDFSFKCIMWHSTAFINSVQDSLRIKFYWSTSGTLTSHGPWGNGWISYWAVSSFMQSAHNRQQRAYPWDMCNICAFLWIQVMCVITSVTAVIPAISGCIEPCDSVTSNVPYKMRCQYQDW